MPKLHVINAILQGRKSETQTAVTELYKIIQKPELFAGRQRVYRPYDEENGEKLPSEEQKIQFTVEKVLGDARTRWEDLWNLVAQQDAGNNVATGNIIVDNLNILPNVPVTTLLFLEKQLNDLESFISKLPTPDSSENWSYDPSLGALKTKPIESLRTKKEPAHYVKYNATKEHPAQVEFFHKDVPVGTWQTTLFSGAMTMDKKKQMLCNVRKLLDAVKTARETANETEVPKVEIAKRLFDYILEGN